MSGRQSRTADFRLKAEATGALGRPGWSGALRAAPLLWAAFVLVGEAR